MENKAKLKQAILEALSQVLEVHQISTVPDVLNRYGKDWSKGLDPKPGAVIFPRTTEQLQKIVQICLQHAQPMVPSGGRSGLAAGAAALEGEIVVSMDKMDSILEIDQVGMTMTVEAGAITQRVQEAAVEKGLFFALDLASKGSSQIGGNIATNAGGLKLIRFGGMREQVLGVEVVTGTGEILDLNVSLRKNNIGYDLKQLFIGSEGTLGFITKAVLRLHPPPPPLCVALLAMKDVESIAKVLCKSQGEKIDLYAFEFFDNACLERVLTCQSHMGAPFESRHPYYCLLEFPDQQDQSGHFEEMFADCLEKGWVEDGAISSSKSEFDRLWSYRELISECISSYRFVKKNDVSVPVSLLTKFLRDLDELSGPQRSEIEILSFGHIGDGNVHINYVSNSDADKSELDGVCRQLELHVFALLKLYRGSISAEHGIGLLKRDDLKDFISSEHLEILKNLKKVFDPQGILNPGKIFVN